MVAASRDAKRGYRRKGNNKFLLFSHSLTDWFILDLLGDTTSTRHSVALAIS